MQVQTRITGANSKPNGWYEFELEGHGKVSTRDIEVATQATALIGQPITVDYTEKTSDKLNPHTGRAYTNRYLNALSANGLANVANGFHAPLPAPPSAPLPAPLPAPAPVVQDERGQRAGRNNIAAAVVETLVQLSDQKPETIQRILDGLARWSETGEPLFASFATTQADDSIPF